MRAPLSLEKREGALPPAAPAPAAALPRAEGGVAEGAGHDFARVGVFAPGPLLQRQRAPAEGDTPSYVDAVEALGGYAVGTPVPELPLQQQAPARPARTVQPGGTYKHGGKTWVVYESELRAGGSLSWRNNNPGNIIAAGKFARNHGSIGANGRWAVFPDEQTGSDAKRALVTGTYGSHTIAAMMEKYAPRSENDTDGYIAFLVKKVGVPSTTVVGDLTAAQLDSLIRAMKQKEGWILGEVATCATEWARPILGCE